MEHGAEAHGTAGAGGRDRFARSPLVAIWEVSRACDLACLHCRASAMAEREPDELTTAEGLKLIGDLRGFGRPIFVLTGGDPLKRPDIHALIKAGADAGLTTNLSPSGTPLLTHAALYRARESGLSGVSISLDGPGEDSHDRFRGVRGSFRWSLDGAAATVALGLRLQINTTLTRHNLHELPAIADLVGSLEAWRWTLFVLVATGRATDLQPVTAMEIEHVFEWLHELSRSAPFRIKTTEGPHYRRVALAREASAAGFISAASDGDAAPGGAMRAGSADPAAFSGSGGGRFVPGMNDGSGFLFINSRGDIQPSGFLPITAGNVRSDSLVEVYRDHPLFVALRDPDRLGGRCGRCEFRAICGGSRARAWAASGDYLGEDPACAYEPGATPTAGAAARPA